MTLTSTLMIKKFYKVLFDPDQTTCFSETAFGTSVYHVDNIQEIYPNYSNLMYFSVNSLHTHRYDANVNCYRNFLIENDNVSIPEQIELIKASKIPYSAVTFSGGKSLHFIVSLQTPLQDEQMYRFVGNWIHNIINDGLPESKHFDPKTKNPSRFTRAPGGTNVKFQKDEEGNVIYDNNKNPIIKSRTHQSLMEVKDRVPDSVMEDWLLSHENLKPEIKHRNIIVANDVANPLLLKKWTVHLLKNGIHKGKRNDSFHEIGHDFVAAGFTLDQAVEYIREEVRHLGDFPFSEVCSAVKSAFRGHERLRNDTAKTNNN